MRQRDAFTERPEFIRGREVEKLVAGLLQQRGWYVIPSYDYSGKDDDKAPRMTGQAQCWMIPDLDVAKGGRRIWVEVKAKAASTYHRGLQRWEHGIPLRQFEHYRSVEYETGCLVFLAIYEEDTCCLLTAQLRLLPVRIYDGPLMSRGGMAFFPRDAFKCETLA